jgi:hypothetical protein
VPLPQAVPTLKCSGSNGATALVWSTISQSQYVQELTQTGWGPTSAPGLYAKPHAGTIAVATVHGDLVAVYKPAQ